MLIDVDGTRKTVELWLTNQERQDPEVLASLKPLYRQYGEHSYQVAVFFSGQDTLYANTRELLLRQQRRLLRQRVQNRPESGAPAHD